MKITFEGDNAARFIKALKVVATHASTDEARAHLHAVHFQAYPDALDLVSTDGHRLAIYRFRGAFEPGQVTIPLPNVLDFVKLAGAKPLNIELDTTEGTLTTLGTVMRHVLISVSFPPYAEVIPKGYTTKAPKSMNATYIASACKAFADLNPKKTDGAGVQIRASKDDGPIAFTSEAVSEMMIIVMPMRQTTDGKLPSGAFLSDHALLPGERS
jgi:DNA polymerase III sliding clamp (beta) subunit (PCNA family)